MKKIVATLLVASTIIGSSFATGLTQLELAELLVDKARAENLIDTKAYTEDEIISFVSENNLLEVSDQTAEVSVEVVRQALADYEANKGSIRKQAITPSIVTDEVAYEALEARDRKLTHEFMQMTSDAYEFTPELGSFSLEGDKTFGIASDDKYPLVGKYRYELYRIFGWYAREYNMYVRQTPASVALYRRKSDVEVQNTPLIVVGFDENPTDDNYDGVAYSVRMKVNALYKLDEIEGETLAEGRKRVIATGFKQPHLVMALKDASSLFIKDEGELNAFVDSYVADVVENEGKEYSYDKDRHEVFGDTRYFISKIQGLVFYYIDQDLSVWEE